MRRLFFSRNKRHYRSKDITAPHGDNFCLISFNLLDLKKLRTYSSSAHKRVLVPQIIFFLSTGSMKSPKLNQKYKEIDSNQWNSSILLFRYGACDVRSRCIFDFSPHTNPTWSASTLSVNHIYSTKKQD